MTTIRRLDPRDARDAARWDDFVLAHPQATFFHRAGWGRALAHAQRLEPHYLVAERGAEVTGVLPLAHMKTLLFGNALTSLPFAVYGGALGLDEDTLQALEREADALARKLDAEHLELRQLHRRHEGWPAQDLYVTFRKPILEGEEANMNAIPRKQRAMVRKGIKNGLVAETESGVDRFFALYADNVRRHGTPALSKRWFETLRHEFGRDCEVLVVKAPDGEDVSAVLSFYFRDEVLPYYAGDALAARDLAANDFKYWELLRRACDRGLRTFDYGRSKQGTGPYAFKKNWGFEPTPLSYEYCLYKRESVPQNNPSNRKYRWMIETWRRLPLALTNRLGPLVVRGLG